MATISDVRSVIREYHLVECERHDGRQDPCLVTETRLEQELTAGLPLPGPFLVFLGEGRGKKSSVGVWGIGKKEGGGSGGF